MKIKNLISKLQMLQNDHPNAEIYFTDGNNQEWFETFFQNFNVDEENNMIKILFDKED